MGIRACIGNGRDQIGRARPLQAIQTAGLASSVRAIPCAYKPPRLFVARQNMTDLRAFGFNAS